MPTSSTTSNEGTDKGYVAVGRSGNFLFYDNITTSVTTETKKEVVNGVADTEVVYTTTTEHHQLYPCGTDTASAWEGLGNERIYYQSDTSSSPTLVDLYDNVTVTKTIGIPQRWIPRPQGILWDIPIRFTTRIISG